MISNPWTHTHKQKQTTYSICFNNSKKVQYSTSARPFAPHNTGSHPTQWRTGEKSHPTITGSHPKQAGPQRYTSFIYPWNMVSWTREFWVYLWEVRWTVAKMECAFYLYPNGTLSSN